MELRRITDEVEAQDVFEHVITPHFPVGELEPVAEFCRMIRSGRRCVTVAETDDGRMLGACVVDHLTDTVSRLAWLAVLPDARSLGVGGALLDAAIADERNRGTGLLVAGIDHPGTVSVSTDFGDTTRRARFYQRRGALAVLTPHHHLVHDEWIEFTPLQLIVIPLAGEKPTRIDSRDLIRFELAYLGENADEPEAIDTLRFLSTRDHIELLPLDVIY